MYRLVTILGMLVTVVACSPVKSDKQLTLACGKSNDTNFIGKDFVVNNASIPALFTIHNHSKKSIIINNAHSRRGASAGWSSELQYAKWSAMMVNKTMVFNCLAKNGNRYEFVSCKKIMAVCKVINAKIPKNIGQFWVAENQTETELRQTMVKRRFI